MKDVFEAIDAWDSKLNLFRDHIYFQQIVFTFSILVLIAWYALGFDSGVGMLEIWKNGWKIDYSAYGKSLHFSAFSIYGLLFYGLSRYMQKVDIKGSRNTFYSAFLVLLNISIFEWVYMACFAHFQMKRNLIEWFINDFWFLQQYLLLLMLGLLTLLSFYTESFIFNNNKRVGRKFRFYPDKKMFLFLTITILLMALWVHYPFPKKIVKIDDWQSSPLFPQTHYAYVNANLYVQNDLLHLVNVLTKTMFALSQLFLLAGFKKVNLSKLLKRQYFQPQGL
jgi:hypothetical protein